MWIKKLRIGTSANGAMFKAISNDFRLRSLTLRLPRLAEVKRVVVKKQLVPTLVPGVAANCPSDPKTSGWLGNMVN